MKNELLEALKAKFTGVSENILSRIADKMAKTATTPDQVKAEVEAYTWQKLIEGYGDSRATEATQTAVQTYEKKHNLKDGKPIDQDKGGEPDDKKGGEPTPPTPPAGGDDTPAWAKALIDKNNELTQRLNKMDADRTTATRRQQLNEKISTLPPSLRKAYERTAVESINDDEFEKLMGDIATEAAEIAKEFKAKGAVFGRPSSQTGNQNQEGQLTEAQKEAISRRSGKPKEGEQPF